jgi:uncharacterized membrane protein YhaH (DUF805 family)
LANLRRGLAYLTFLFFGWSGRIPRRVYWVAWTIAMVATSGLQKLLLQAFAESGVALDDVLTLLAFAVFVPLELAIVVKRLHDRNRSAGWVVPFYIVPVCIGWAALLIFSPESWADRIALWVAIACAFWGTLEIGFMPGTKGPNRYGPDPRPPSADAATQHPTWGR